MIDAAEVNSGVGIPVATDLVDSKHFQRIKLDLGGDGVSDAVERALPVVAAGYDGLVRSTGVTVTVVATPLPASPLAERKSVIVQNRGTGSVFLGGSGVTDDTGIELRANADFAADIATALLYAISAASDQDVRVLEVA